MSRLDTIIRLRKWELDEVRRALTRLEEEGSAISDAMTELDRQLQAECAGSAAHEASVTLGPYITAVRQKKEQLQELLTAKNIEIEEKQDEVSQAYNELKKIEVARDRRLMDEKAERDRKEQAIADETGSRKFFESDRGSRS